MMITMKSINNNSHYTSDDAMAERKSGRNVVNKKLLKCGWEQLWGGGGWRMQFMVVSL